VSMVLVACGAAAPALPVDDAATYREITGDNGQEFLRQFSSHDWFDGGRAAADKLERIAHDAKSSDATPAKRAGEAKHAIATFIASNNKELAHVPAGWFGLKHEPVGALNPELVRGYASALSPFLGALVGDVKSAPGFTIMSDGVDVSSARNVFAVIDTSTQAGNELKDAADKR